MWCTQTFPRLYDQVDGGARITMTGIIAALRARISALVGLQGQVDILGRS